MRKYRIGGIESAASRPCDTTGRKRKGGKGGAVFRGCRFAETSEHVSLICSPTMFPNNRSRSSVHNSWISESRSSWFPSAAWNPFHLLSVLPSNRFSTVLWKRINVQLCAWNIHSWSFFGASSPYPENRGGFKKKRKKKTNEWPLVWTLSSVRLHYFAAFSYPRIWLR